MALSGLLFPTSRGSPRPSKRLRHRLLGSFLSVLQKSNGLESVPDIWHRDRIRQIAKHLLQRATKNQSSTPFRKQGRLHNRCVHCYSFARWQLDFDRSLRSPLFSRNTDGRPNGSILITRMIVRPVRLAEVLDLLLDLCVQGHGRDVRI